MRHCHDKWKEAVFKRDGYECRACNGEFSNELHAQHMTGHGYNPYFRTKVENGITLCEICHTNFHHIYGYSNAYKDNLVSFCKAVKKDEDDNWYDDPKWNIGED